jgi:hypothetical protein
MSNSRMRHPGTSYLYFHDIEIFSFICPKERGKEKHLKPSKILSISLNMFKSFFWYFTQRFQNKSQKLPISTKSLNDILNNF